jgi:hypothetical protein
MKFPVSDMESPKLYIAVMPSTVDLGLGADGDGAGEGGSGLLPRQPMRRMSTTRKRRRPFAAISC